MAVVSNWNYFLARTLPDLYNGEEHSNENTCAIPQLNLYCSNATFKISIRSAKISYLVHKDIMAKHWQYFRNVLDSNMSECAQEHLELPADFPPLLLKHLIFFCYAEDSAKDFLKYQKSYNVELEIFLQDVGSMYYICEFDGTLLDASSQLFQLMLTCLVPVQSLKISNYAILMAMEKYNDMAYPINSRADGEYSVFIFRRFGLGDNGIFDIEVSGVAGEKFREVKFGPKYGLPLCIWEIIVHAKTITYASSQTGKDFRSLFRKCVQYTF